MAEAPPELPTPPELMPILVSRRELDEEKEKLASDEGRLVELEDVWNLFVEAHPDRLLVSLQEWRIERSRLGGLKSGLNVLWSAWGRTMLQRRTVLEQYRIGRYALRPLIERMSLITEADRLLIEIRRLNEEIKARKSLIEDETERFHLKTLIPPELLETLQEINHLTAEIETERERIGRKVVIAYEVWQFSKYYKYGKEGTYKYRHFEIRADFTIVPDLDEADLNEVKEVIEWKFDDVMERLGIRVGEFPEQGPVEMGAEVLESADKFKEEVVATVYDLKRKKTYTRPEYDTTIHVDEEEMPWFKKEEGTEESP